MPPWPGRVAPSTGSARRPSSQKDLTSEPALDAGCRLVIPGLIDCHTHLAFGGWRADEFAERLSGASYEEVARRGGGIRRTVAQTRAASKEELIALCRDRLRDMGRPRRHHG